MSKKQKRRIIFFVLPIMMLASFMLYKFTKLLNEYTDLQAEKELLEQFNSEAVEANEKLLDTKEKLNDPEYMKSYAKQKYIYVEENGQTIIISLVDESEDDE